MLQALQVCTGKVELYGELAVGTTEAVVEADLAETKLVALEVL